MITGMRRVVSPDEWVATTQRTVGSPAQWAATIWKEVATFWKEDGSFVREAAPIEMGQCSWVERVEEHWAPHVGWCCISEINKSFISIKPQEVSDEPPRFLVLHLARRLLLP